MQKSNNLSAAKIKKALNLNTSTTVNSRNNKQITQSMVGIQLTTPTSISMMNSFIIKNADTSFDQYYTSMKKRKQIQNTSFNPATSTANYNTSSQTLGN